MQQMKIDGAFTFTPRIFADNRGTFCEWFRAAEFLGDLGYRFELAQANCSVSRRGVVRGVHFTEVPPGQAKYVICAGGAVMDVVVDLRVGSSTFLSWEAVQLDDESRRAVFLTEGLGHAFVALSPQATVMYLCSTPYAPAIEHGVDPFDPEIGIAWPQDMEFVLSGKDAAAPSADQARRAGLLPAFDACAAVTARARQQRP
jgi:dTDP-4-dehydrorhamnose 3,5-epimerase